MLAVESKSSAPRNATICSLPLESGEFMHSREFLRRYERKPWMKRTELIEGVVYLGPRATASHGRADGLIQARLHTYASRHPSTEALPNAPVILDAENTVQADALLLRCLRENGDLGRVNEDGYLAGPPELIVKVAASSASIDLRDIRWAGRSSGVRQYLVWVEAEALPVSFCLEDDEYRPQLLDAQDMLYSLAFPGIRQTAEPLVACDIAKVPNALRECEAPHRKPPETGVRSDG
jgi:hypothetical protein